MCAYWVEYGMYMQNKLQYATGMFNFYNFGVPLGLGGDSVYFESLLYRYKQSYSMQLGLSSTVVHIVPVV